MMAGYRSLGKPEEATALHVEFTRKTMRATAATARDIAEVIGKSGADVVGVARERIGAEGAARLSHPARSAKLADLAVSKLPAALALVDKSGLPSFTGEQIRIGLKHVEIAPLVAGFLSAAVEKGSHQQALDELLDGLEKLVNDAPAMETVRDRMFEKLPALFNLYRGEPIVMNKIIEATKALIVEIRADNAHPVRTELDGFLAGLIERLRGSSEFASRLVAFKLDLLERPELGDLAAEAWNNLRDVLVRDTRSESSVIRRQVEAIFADVGA